MSWHFCTLEIFNVLSCAIKTRKKNRVVLTGFPNDWNNVKRTTPRLYLFNKTKPKSRQKERVRETESSWWMDGLTLVPRRLWSKRSSWLTRPGHVDTPESSALHLWQVVWGVWISSCALWLHVSPTLFQSCCFCWCKFANLSSAALTNPSYSVMNVLMETCRVWDVSLSSAQSDVGVNLLVNSLSNCFRMVL